MSRKTKVRSAKKIASTTNDRRHEPEWAISDNDLITGKDAKRIVKQEIREQLAAYELVKEQQRLAAENAFDALPWWKRVWLNIQFSHKARRIAQDVAHSGTHADAHADELKPRG